ncbi:MAG: right-handed parallel beta-helix repeat-containing protein [Halioglobus sp.]|nr:right-handed parallel beta-helix repeat-containing protein [Halioglobus sp.]
MRNVQQSTAKKAALLLCSCAILGASQAYATDYYVDNVNGNDTNLGTATSPWQSLSYSVERLVANDTLILTDNGPSAPYREAIVPKTSGVNGQIITISGAAPDARPFVVGSVNWSDRSAGGEVDWDTTDGKVFTLTDVPALSALWISSTEEWASNGVSSLLLRDNADSDNITAGMWHYSDDDQTLSYKLIDGETIDNLHIEAVVSPNLVSISARHYINVANIQFLFSAGTAVSVVKASTSISLNNIDVKHASKNAITAQGGENITIEDCNIDDVGNNGIVIKGSADNKLANSIIRGCNISRVHTNDCITLHKNTSLDGIGSGHLVENNVLSQCGEQGIDVTSGSDITLLGNTTYGNGDSGIVLGHGVTSIAVENHLSVDDGQYAGILVNAAQDISIANSCILDSVKHQVVFRDAEDVSFNNNVVYQSQDRYGSLIDIALDSSSIDFASNQILSESVYDTLLLRYLQDNNPIATSVYFYSNSWSTPVQNARSVATSERGRHAFQDHNQHYGRNSSDNSTANNVYASLEQAININKCNLDLIPEQYKRWEYSNSLSVETVSVDSEVPTSKIDLIPPPPGC